MPRSLIIKTRQHLSLVRNNKFIRNAGLLVGGTAFAQALMIAILPILTRLYSPEDFTVLAIYVSVLGIFSSIACMRLDIAIPIPDDDDEATSLLVLSLISATSLAAITLILICFWPNELAALSGQPKIESYLWLLPLGIWFSGTYSALQFWATRKKKFIDITKTRFSQAISSSCVQLGFGWAGITPLGLLLGQLINSGAGAIGLAFKTINESAHLYSRIKPNHILYTLRKYDHFPKYSTLEALANSGSIQLPILIIAAIAAGPEAGFLVLATRIMAAPMGLIGGAVAQVYISQAPEEMRHERLGSFTASIIGGLFKSGAGPLIFAGIIAPTVFPLVFGADWTRTGVIISWMTPWFLMQFISSPVSMILHLTNNQKAALLLQITGLIIRVGSLLVAALFFNSSLTELYALSGFIFYTAYMGAIIWFGKIQTKDLAKALSSGWSYILIWTLLAIATNYALK
ncbi:lipopolysaccharide biosynthesis protein [Pseudomonas sp. GL-RE-20]|uniref:lipopolysaccharide biosynthesis protein n=1 Tax=Pseudomonas sp. GL-RE-20 TaxID=2832372 RepID=UPI001CBCD28E|nr:oligosaccharide flippase family protein [Pseudomonas sp. GL-RE-20]